MTTVTLPVFGPTCPSGGLWWACGTGTYFVGCCAKNPCQITCPQGDLYPAGFDPAYHGKFPDATCGSGSQFWTCTAGNTFMGCCKTNPCSANGCSRESLAPTFLDRDELRVAYGAVSSARSSTARSATSTLSTTASGTTSRPTATGDAAAASAEPKKDASRAGAISGGAAGGAIAVAVVIALLIYYFCHAKKSRRGHEETVVRRQSDLAAMLATQSKNIGTYPADAPPSYMSPYPNSYWGPHAGQYDYQYQHQQYRYAPQPLELAIEPRSPGSFSRKPISGHQRNLSELSSENTIRPELETPFGTPQGESHVTSPLMSPQSRAPADWQSGSNSIAHQSWQTQGGSEYSHDLAAQGLGLQGLAGTMPDHQPDTDLRYSSRA